MESLAAFAIASLLGSIPFGLLLTRLAGTQDLRSVGSGNIGATNVLRTGHKGLAAATLLLDMLKGLAAALIAQWLFGRWFPDGVAWAGLGVVAGHCFPVWLGFKGGKGVATAAGVCFGLIWPIGLIYAGVWIGLLAITRISSLAGISAALAAPIAAAMLGEMRFVPVLAVIAALVLWQHRAYISRLARGEEPRIGASK